MQIKLLAKQKNLGDWAAVLPEAVATYNKKRHSTTKHSPADVWGWRSLRKLKDPQVQQTYATLTSAVRAHTIAAAEKNLARCKTPKNKDGQPWKPAEGDIALLSKKVYRKKHSPVSWCACMNPHSTEYASSWMLD